MATEWIYTVSVYSDKADTLIYIKVLQNNTGLHSYHLLSFHLAYLKLPVTERRQGLL